MFFKIIALKQAVKKTVALYSQRHKILCDFELHTPLTCNATKYVFPHIFSYSNCCFLCVVIKVAAFVYL